MKFNLTEEEKKMFEEESNLLNEKRKTVKRGPNVIHVEYLGLEESDLEEIENKLSEASLELSSFNKSRVTYNSLDDFSFVTFIVLNQSIIIEFLKSVGTNAAWDVLKEMIKLTRNKIKNRKYYKVTSQGSQEKEITFGLQVNLDKNTGFNFELKGDLSDEVIGKSLDKVFDFLNTQNLNKEYQSSDFVKYSEKEEKWISLNVMEEIRKRQENKK